MNYADTARARDARMMNGTMMLGGRNPSSLEVGLALGLNERRDISPGLGAQLAMALRFWTGMRPAALQRNASISGQAAGHKV